MLRNYLKIAIRTIGRHKLFSFINIFGLALSMSVCMMVMLRLKDQLSYDKFHPQADKIYRIISEASNNKGDKFSMASTPLPLRPLLQDANNVVQESVNIYPAINEKGTYDTKSITLSGVFTDASFFRVFGFSLATGNATIALQSPNSMVLSEEAAKKFFGDENPVGKIITFDKLGSFTVTGVLENKGNSHISYDVYASAASLPQLEKSGVLAANSGNWDTFDKSYTYVLLKEKASVAQLESVLGGVASLINQGAKEGSFAFKAQSLNSITPSSLELSNSIGAGSDWSKIWTEIGIALIILIAACFNYTNLTIARALTRAKEVGIRKVSGAVRYQVFMQYIIESVVIALLGLALANVFLQLILEFKPFNDGYEMVPVMRLDVSTFLWFFTFALVTGILAGAAPAWILSSFKPLQVLKNISTHRLFGNVSLQKTLIVFQFSLSLIVIIFLSSFYRQFSYMATAELGFNKDNIVTIPLNGADHKLFRNEALRLPGVEDVTALSANFGTRGAGKMHAAPDKGVQPLQLDYYYSDASVVQTMGLTLLAGSSLPQNTSTQERYILLNEKAVAALKFKNNAEALGKTVWVDDSTQLQVVGVVRDFYFQGAAHRLSPLAFRQKEGEYKLLNVRVAASGDTRVAEQLAASWKKIYPGKPFTHSWLGKEIAAMNSQTASVSFLAFLAFITISIASLGLLGLVIYTVETKRKEISIRKVIGAGIDQLMLLLSKGFIKLLLIAGCIALPIGYVLSAFFLQNFANRVDMGIGWLFLCFGFMLMIGLCTILSQTYRASAANPIDSLRTE